MNTRKRLVSCALLMSLSCFGQTGSSGFNIVTSQPPVITYVEKLTQKGHYVVVIDDPNNQWRCNIVSHEGDRSGAATFTVVCTKLREVEKEK